MMRAMCLLSCEGSPFPIRTLQRGQWCLNFLKPGRQQTRQQMAKADLKCVMCEARERDARGDLPLHSCAANPSDCALDMFIQSKLNFTSSLSSHRRFQDEIEIRPHAEPQGIQKLSICLFRANLILHLR